VPVERRELKLIHQAPAEVQPNSPVSLPVKVVDPLRLVDQVHVFFRRQGIRIFTDVAARADENVSVVIPALALPPDEKGYQIEYFVRAVDRWEGTLAEDGSARQPKVFKVAPQSTSSSSILSSWLFWTVIGLAAVGTVFVGVAASGGGDDFSLLIKDKGVAGR
jgi:hypothetical protein